MSNIAIVLCGSGRFDGSEIQESVLTLLHLSRAGAKVQCFAPDAPAWATCDGFSGEPTAEAPRNMLQEAARIARADILPLSQAKAEHFDALILPGGNGAARNLCDFAENGSEGSVIPDLQSLLDGFRAAAKPIGAICITPAIVALAFRGQGIRLTLGDAEQEPTLSAIGTGQHWVTAAVDEIVVDEEAKVVSTPAYILGPDIAAVDRGIGLLVQEVLRLAAARS